MQRMREENDFADIDPVFFFHFPDREAGSGRW
jgi:hypothetical protein